MKHHIIIGTAGHVDHGKTALIRALTGRDTDRLEEEKRRGITIDLGFTWMDLPNGMRAGIIDVPGHERFISNMTAGVAGMDLVLLVIAADEGIMPQTREHLDILRLLGVENYIVVLNKCDLVDQEWIEFLKEEIAEELEKNLKQPTDKEIEKSEIVCVSAKTGEGIEELKKTIISYVENHARMWKTSSVSRLPVDRVFSVRGAGTVVTGTLLGGKIRTEDQLMIYPEQTLCRIREIQVHGERVEQAEEGQRVALNLAGIDKKQDVSVKTLGRGTVLVKPGSMSVGKIFNVRMELVKDRKREIKNQTRLHFYSGTSEVLCRAVPLEKEILLPGESGYVQLRMEKETALCRGDRFVVRFYSPLETIGGGVILETDARKERRFQEKVINRLKQAENGTEEERAEQYLLQQERMISVEHFLKRLETEFGIPENKAEDLLQEMKEKQSVISLAVKGKEWIWSREKEEEQREQIQKLFGKWLKEHPYNLGMPKAEVISKLSQEWNRRTGSEKSQNQTGQKKESGLITGRKTSEKILADAYVEWLKEQHVLKRIVRNCEESEIFGDILLAPEEYEPKETDVYRKMKIAFYQEAERAGMTFCELTDFVEKRLLSEKDSRKLQMEELRDMFALMEYRKEAVRITENVYTVPKIADYVRNDVADLLDHYGKITIIQVRDQFGTGRKNAKRILEYTDRIGMTRKDGAETEHLDNRKNHSEH
nr:selenocysteine-specific translation elongation factor [uncultured Mediterraneibacter sp.]